MASGKVSCAANPRDILNLVAIIFEIVTACLTLLARVYVPFRLG